VDRLVFGFEIFKTNSFEQLMVNLANEKLQHFFLDTIFKTEQALYLQEGVGVPDVEAPDNSATIGFIEGKPHGVLPLLDEQCRLGERGTDANLCARLNDLNPSCKRSIAELGQKERRGFDSTASFRLQHFVEPVTYSSANFIEKNRDTFHTELSTVLACSSSPFVQVLFPMEEDDEPSTGSRGGGGERGGGAMRTYASVATSFVASLSELLDDLRSADASFVRCIKPSTFPCGSNRTFPCGSNRGLLHLRSKTAPCTEGTRTAALWHPHPIARRAASRCAQTPAFSRTCATRGWCCTSCARAAWSRP